MENLTNLAVLYLSGNQIKELANEIYNLAKLRSLYLIGNENFLGERVDCD